MHGGRVEGAGRPSKSPTSGIGKDIPSALIKVPLLWGSCCAGRGGVLPTGSWQSRRGDERMRRVHALQPLLARAFVTGTFG
jgi:hypothetical protein